MNIIRKATIILGAICLTAMTLITCVDVFMRYFFNNPIFGSGEMTQMLLGIAVFAGMFAVTRDRGHVNVSLFEPFLIRHLRAGYRTLFDGTTLVGVVSVTVILMWRVWDLTHYPEETVVLSIPMIWIVSGMMVLSALSVVAAILAMRDKLEDTPPHSPQQSE